MATTLFFFEKRIAVIGFLFAVSLIGCGRGSGSPPTPSNKPTPAPTQSANWKLSLNQEKLGTTSDTSALSKMLSQVMKNRREQRVARPGTGQIETTIYLDAERAIGIGDVIKVVEVAKEAGASPVLLPIIVDFDQAGDIKPNPLTLLLKIGEPERKAVIKSGIELIVGPAISRSESDTIPKQFVVVTIPKDGEYRLDQTVIPKESLSNELKSRLQTTQDKRICFVFDANGDVRYRSLSEVAQAAVDAGGSEIYLIALN
jgi:biopolymer transport protein ExbD